VLARATADGLAVLTFNRRHFKRLHQQMPQHAGKSFARAMTTLRR
jgi:hypothetical protein